MALGSTESNTYPAQRHTLTELHCCVSDALHCHPFICLCYCVRQLNDNRLSGTIPVSLGSARSLLKLYTPLSNHMDKRTNSFRPCSSSRICNRDVLSWVQAVHRVSPSHPTLSAEANRTGTRQNCRVFCYTAFQTSLLKPFSTVVCFRELSRCGLSGTIPFSLQNATALRQLYVELPNLYP